MWTNFMTHTVNVLRLTGAKDAAGGETGATTTAYTGLRCRVQPVSSNWLIRYAVRQSDTTHAVFFVDNPTLYIGDKIIYNSRTLYVQGIRDQQEAGRVLVADCKEIVVSH
jgi:hypothetical protein